MRKIFWFAVGVGVTVFVVTKGKEFLHKLTPAGVTEQVSEQGKQAMHRLQTFVRDLNEAMDERETELRTELNMAPKA